MKKKFLKILSTLLLSTLVFVGCAKAPKDAMIKIGDVYIVEKQVSAEADKILNSFTDEQRKEYDESTDSGKKNLLDLKQNILDQMSNTEIIRQKMNSVYEKSKKEGKTEEELKTLIVSDDEVKEQITRIKEQVGGEDKFKEELEKFKITEEELFIQLKDQLYGQKFQIWFSKNNEPSIEEIEKKYVGSEFEGPEIDVSHILVKTEEEANKVKERLNKGEKLEEIAKEISIDPSATSNSGKLGKFIKGVLVSEFYEAAIKLSIGEISSPVKTDFGFHIIQLNSIEKEYGKFSEESKKQIELKLKNIIVQEKYKDEFENIKKEIGVYPIKSFK